jgi:hypothetical protein
MNARTLWRRGALPLSALVLLTIGSQSGSPQAPPPPVDLPRIGSTPPVAQAIESPPTVEAIIDQLEQLRKQKAELEAREKTLVNQLKGRLKNQSDRLQKLGVAPVQPPPPAKEDVKFLDAVVPPVPARDDLKAFDLPLPKK